MEHAILIYVHLMLFIFFENKKFSFYLSLIDNFSCMVLCLMPLKSFLFLSEIDIFIPMFLYLVFFFSLGIYY